VRTNRWLGGLLAAVNVDVEKIGLLVQQLAHFIPGRKNVSKGRFTLVLERAAVVRYLNREMLGSMPTTTVVWYQPQDTC
jgi:hypothetical protein